MQEPQQAQADTPSAPVASVAIRAATAGDAEAMARIYNHYIRETIVTFEEEPVDGATMAARLQETAAVSLPWLVAEAGGGVLGYAYASKWKGRCAYRYSVESTVYLDPAQTGRGVGTQLYAALLDALRARSLHAVIGGIALPNAASVGLHERLGFEKVAQFREVGFKFGRWIDVGYWQLLI
jgi:L-amino acid N-acyltransferase YncA